MNGLIVQWVNKGVDGFDSGDSEKNFFQFPISFSSKNYVTSFDQLFIAGIAGTKVFTKTTNKIIYNWDTRTVKATSIIAIGY